MKKIATLAAMLTAFSVIPQLTPRSANAIGLPMPAPTVPAAPLVHYPTYIQFTNSLNSCYHNDGTNSFNGTCSGNIPSPSPSGAPADLTVLANYVTYGEGNQSGIGNLGAGGIQIGVYTDPFLLHGGLSSSVGPNATNKGASIAGICANAYPQAVQLTTNFYGNGVYLPANNVSSCGGNYYGSILGNVGQPAANFWLNYIESAYQFNLATSLAGYSGGTLSISNGLSFVRMDDADYPGHRLGFQLNCFGPATSLGTSSPGATVTACSDARVNSFPAYVGSHPYFRMNPYPNFMHPQWVADAKALFRMPAALGMKTVINDFTDASYVQYISDSDNANVSIVQCEICFTRNAYAGGTYPLYSQKSWQQHVNAAIVAQEYGVKFNAFRVMESSVADSIYSAATFGLMTIDPAKIVVTQNLTPGGNGGTLTVPNSLILANPLVYLVPSQPINRPASFYFSPTAVNYNPNNEPYTSFGIGTLQQPGGAYLQEYTTCYNGSSGTPVAIGHCAYIVVPPGVTATMPSTTYTYTHTATYTGTGIVTPAQFGGGDTGVLSLAGGAAPASGTSLTAGTAYILTP